MKTKLLIIDPQYDFCHPNGALFVPGANDDIDRLSALIDRVGNELHDIHVTLDTHHELDVAHPLFWIDSQGSHPAPFTTITHDDVVKGRFMPAVTFMHRRMLDYTKALDDNGRYQLTIWPPHCLIGSPGHNIMPNLLESLSKWERERDIPAMVDFVTKGSNIYTEHYSAVQADVPDNSDPTTTLNGRLIQALQDADCILIAGEALSHCVANTVLDIADNFGDENVKKMCLLEDCSSSVPGFEKLGEDFVRDMKARGMSTASSVDIVSV